MAIKRYVGLGKQTQFETETTISRYLESVADVEPDQGWIIPASIAQREQRKRNLGFFLERGTIGDFEAEPENIGELLLGAFGSVTTTNPATGVYQHVFSPADTIPSWTLELGVDIVRRVITGMLVNKLTFRMPHDDNLKANVGVICRGPENRQTLPTPSTSTLQAFVFPQLTLSLAGIDKASQCYDGEIYIDNRIPVRSGGGVRYMPNIRVGQRKVGGKLSLHFDDTIQYDRFLAGTEFTLLAKWIGPLISGSYYYQLELELRKCVYLRGVAPGPKPQDEPLVIDAPFEAFYDTTAGFNAEAKATLINTIVSY
jgi:hypothetical protein